MSGSNCKHLDVCVGVGIMQVTVSKYFVIGHVLTTSA